MIADVDSVQLIVTDVIEESHDARSLVFAEAAGLDYRPGQFLTLRVPGTDGGAVARCYSLASSPHTDAAPKVTIKRVDGGYGSNWLCDNVVAGHVIESLPPSGTFTPADLDRDLVLWAGGSGITPVMSILKSALAVGRGRVTLVYANRDERSVIFAAELRGLVARHPDRFTVAHWLESVQGLPGREQLAALARRFAGGEAYLCGPAPFMAAVQGALADAGVARDAVHTEVFRSLTGDPFAEVAPVDTTTEDGADLRVDLDGRQHGLRWPRQSTLVDTMIAAGLDVPYSCREGQCGSCAATLRSGRVDMPDTDILEPEDIEAGTILGCQATPASDDVHIEF
ncbi:ferredoxin--NADP reductase [Mycolicibacterium monacense]|uniref:3-ketosteroid-9-alpha-hydroxylase reductase subunit n=1 Tax=Mycolicibacterium monacense TaxID=85693 RepID=A0AAD1J0N3_MYCMB|nr:ferredoxin--NADP reductase [Mycolicibacterium monacense]MDA4104269.1 ferredoxin [Mycolicibacterium monacense DSM 44395]OBB60995.1 3-ketosteroid-9-alpha-hydroxylase [Mycolicibacterium monacense]ORB24654.1 3-ketosteroid-9-alpha-hydroxylase [Mycolicibacterium monacense DSM 44395]QHP84179.1 ferredoxin--NADP reductase [Mycolicibacterium monacense DSM 44395]BBZ63092.1 3-ketosteroid-9-alpha-hydroxylase reductase subunit [Mycolicibacterium monacense]